jgi:hypothetical protein
LHQYSIAIRASFGVQNIDYRQPRPINGRIEPRPLALRAPQFHVRKLNLPARKPFFEPKIKADQ